MLNLDPRVIFLPSEMQIDCISGSNEMLFNYIFPSKPFKLKSKKKLMHITEAIKETECCRKRITVVSP